MLPACKQIPEVGKESSSDGITCWMLSSPSTHLNNLENSRCLGHVQGELSLIKLSNPCTAK